MSNRTIALLWLAAALVFAPAALAQETISDCGHLHIAIFCEDDVAALDSAAALSPEQKEAIRLLMTTAVDRARIIHGKFYRQCVELRAPLHDATLTSEDYEAADKIFRREYHKLFGKTTALVVAVERETLADIRAALTREQFDSAWPAFERSRRRTLIEARCHASDIGFTPRQLLRALKPDAAETAAAAPILAAYDDRLDPLLISRVNATKLAAQALADTGVYDKAARHSPALMSREILALNTRTAVELENVLSEKARDLFLRLRIGAEMDHQFTPPRLYHEVELISQLTTLSADQRDSITALAAAADNAAFAVALAALRDQDRRILSGQYPDPSDPDPPLDPNHAAHIRNCADIASRLAKDLRALLTPAQTDALDTGAHRLPDTAEAFKTPRSTVPSSEWDQAAAQAP